jgi:hypothetical protein
VEIQIGAAWHDARPDVAYVMFTIDKKKLALTMDEARSFASALALGWRDVPESVSHRMHDLRDLLLSGVTHIEGLSRYGYH